jgi:DtxR family Mn-dependent transcriptional regulator
MLSEVFGMEWHEIHEEAERLEHAVSPAFEAKLREKLGESGACPHGNEVLPAPPAERKRRGELQLSEAQAGRQYTVVSLHERDPKLLSFLHQAGIGPGKRVRVVSQNYDQTVSIELDKGNSILGRPAADAVWLRQGTREQGDEGTSRPSGHRSSAEGPGTERGSKKLSAG